jgi:hypothetical protein
LESSKILILIKDGQGNGNYDNVGLRFSSFSVQVFGFQI